MLDRKTLTKRLKTMFGAHHFVFSSQEVADISAVVNLSPEHLQKLMRSPYWDEALAYWGYTPPIGDLKIVEDLWAELIENGEDLNPVEYPEEMIGVPSGNHDVYALINSHLFCVDNLSDEEIRKRLAEEGKFESPPVKFEGQPLENTYHWWIYPNYDDGIYSKTLARPNITGDLVVGRDDETALVCIKHGRFSLTRTVSNDIANISDDRLFVCL